MSDSGPFEQRPPMPIFAGAALPAAALAGVRGRRIVAFVLDFVLVSVLAAGLATVLFIVTLGVSLVVLPSLWPFVAFFYNGLTVSGRSMATPGMRVMDLEMRAEDGAPVSFVAAGVHAVLLYISWMFVPVFLVSLVIPNKRCLHDIVAGILVVRRPF